MAKGKVGRPKKADQLGINLNGKEENKRLSTYCQLGLTKEEIANLYQVSLSTFHRIFKEQLNSNFDTFYKKHNTELKLSARRMKVKKAQEGDTTMIIYLNKTTGDLTEYERRQLALREQELEVRRLELLKDNEEDGEDIKQNMKYLSELFDNAE